MDTDDAIRRVARQVLYEQIQRYPPVWEDYPDIGEHDWARVVAYAIDLPARLAPTDSQYAAAYQHLVDRVEVDS